jgi:lipoprotein NlpI
MKHTWILLALAMSLNVNWLAAEDDAVLRLVALAQGHSRAGAHAKAVKALTEALALKPGKEIAAAVHQERGYAFFKLAKIKESIADFDAFLKVNPGRDPHHWQRGISYYYTKEFKKGYEQFERHQVVNSNDVENAVWHFLCLARAKGIAEAKKKLIPIVGDGRIPMMEVHALFAGKSTPEKILAKARADGAKGARLERQLFYAHLYLGIWYEATGELKLRDKYIGHAAAVADEHGYMGDVARVHAVLNKIAVPKSKPKPKNSGRL